LHVVLIGRAQGCRIEMRHDEERQTGTKPLALKKRPRE
jgi:hypothetical protein